MSETIKEAARVTTLVMADAKLRREFDAWEKWLTGGFQLLKTTNRLSPAALNLMREAGTIHVAMRFFGLDVAERDALTVARIGATLDRWGRE